MMGLRARPAHCPGRGLFYVGDDTAGRVVGISEGLAPGNADRSRGALGDAAQELPGHIAAGKDFSGSF